MINNTNSVLVTLSVSFWSGYKHDKSASEETIEKNQMEKGAGRFNKKLLPKFAVKKIKDIITHFKTFFSENTLPYNLLLGTRILPTDGFMDFQKEVSITQGLLNTEVNAFIAQYDEYRRMAQKMLGSLYNEKDYPTIEELRNKFKIEITYFPVPEPARFNASIGNKQMQKLTAQLEEMSVLVKMDLVYRTEKVTLALLDTLEKEDKRVHKTTVTDNITKLSEQLGTLNYDNDPLIAEIKECVDENILGIRVDDVKDSPRFRAKMIEKANAVLTLVNEIIESHENS